ncbi:MAG: diaminopimelate decarboxylase [Candidatus Cloacimonas sp. 4484_209]|nr:MAG: diaminopimelate decarboxylase [Candidatus Cloacimonas sp. 4484_209]
MLKKCQKRLKKIKTPFYIYDETVIKRNISFLKRTFSSCNPKIFFAVKANTSLAVLKTVQKERIGAEVVSPGEIFLARKAGFLPNAIMYNNVARKKEEVIFALKRGINFFNFEAIDQARLLEECAGKLKKRIKLFVRVNLGVIPGTHSHLSTGSPLSKFGIEERDVLKVIKVLKDFRFAKLTGIHSHIGSQILTPSPFLKAVKRVERLINVFKKHKINIRYVNLGGGFGIPYQPNDVALDFQPIVKSYKNLAEHHNVKIILEPGRFIVGNAGFIITKVISVKSREGTPLYIVDADMTENPRPAIYRAYHHIEPLSDKNGKRKNSRIVGPLCENSNEFGTFKLPPLEIGDTLIIHNSGAYTRTMASNYNGRLLAAEYSYDGNHIKQVRRKQTLNELLEDERI